jgi:hypothetical protein
VAWCIGSSRGLDLTVDELRRRRSVKWRFEEPDVVPLWVAEIDVRLVEPIRHVLAELVERTDTGYVTRDGLPKGYACLRGPALAAGARPGPDLHRSRRHAGHIRGPAGRD